MHNGEIAHRRSVLVCRSYLPSLNLVAVRHIGMRHNSVGSVMAAVQDADLSTG
jgi:hypothetical protein